MRRLPERGSRFGKPMSRDSMQRFIFIYILGALMSAGFLITPGNSMTYCPTTSPPAYLYYTYNFNQGVH